MEHAWEIQAVLGLTGFAATEAELTAWLDARAWMTGDGPKALFTDAVAWLQERNVLLPGVSRLARLVARVREEAARRLWDTLRGLLGPREQRLLDRLLEVPDRARISEILNDGAGARPRPPARA